jgi:hypothetical protein
MSQNAVVSCNRDFLRPQSLELGSTFIYGVRISFESFSGV